MNYLPLHLHSAYTLLGSGLSINKLIAKAVKEKYPFLVISDKDSISAFPRISQASKNYNIAPFYGVDLEIENNLYTLFIFNEEGYRNVNLLLYENSKNSLTKDFFIKHLNGLKVVFNPENSQLPYLFENDQNDCFNSFKELVTGINELYIGIPYSQNKEFIEFIREKSKDINLECLAFPLILYEKSEDEILLRIVKAIASDTRLEEKTATGINCYLEDEIAASYYTEKERQLTFELPTSADFIFNKKRGGLLVYQNNKGMSSEDYLAYAVKAGLKARKPNYDNRYIERLNYELSVINKMGYADYFLIVADYVSWAKKNGISVGPGRGSGAGSLVSFCLGIVSIDPIKYGLLFERFLNPQRQSMPDIDVDFADIRRDDVAAYLIKKYGTEHVSHIVTMQTLGAKASLRDIGRVFGYENREIDLIAKSIKNPKLTLRDNYRQNPKFKKIVDSDSFYLEIVSLASKIEGLPRQKGLHAAGVILNNTPLQEVIPVGIDETYGFVAEYEAPYMEQQGFLKMDLLGLSNLTIVDICIANIYKNKGIKIDYSTIPSEDRESITKIIGQNRTMGIFQLESRGMNSAIRELKPNCFDDIVALLALYRPGPMSNISTYAKRKSGEERISYLVPELEPILSSTYGVIVYQEQIMQIVRKIAGYDYGKADLFRRAISKKDVQKLESLKLDFIKSSVRNGFDKQTATDIFALIHKFANYGFNKSHSVAYAVLACQMAYLKFHYPIEFYCAILDTTSTSDSKYQKIISEIRAAKIKLALPDINETSTRYICKNDTIIYPLTGIKGINFPTAKAIIEERENNGKYSDIFDFSCRNIKNGLTKELLVRLVSVGCFDSLDRRRATLRLSSTLAINYAETMVGNSGKDLLLNLDFPKPKLIEIEDNVLDDVNDERLYLGIMISGSPLSLKQDIINDLKLHRLAEIDNFDTEVEVAAIVLDSKVVLTKTNKKMAFIHLYDETTQIEGTMFADVYSDSYSVIGKGALVRVKLIKDKRKENAYLINSIKEL